MAAGRCASFVSNKQILPGNWIAIVAAAWPSMGIGINKRLPWNIPEDMKYFKKTTEYTPATNLKNVVVMGRKTWESLKYRPLPNRINIILSRQDISKELSKEEAKSQNIFIASSLSDANEVISSLSNVYKTFVIGGEEVYKSTLEMNYVSQILLTRVHLPDKEKLSFDSFFPQIDEKWTYNIIDEGTDHLSNINFEFLSFHRK